MPTMLPLSVPPLPFEQVPRTDEYAAPLCLDLSDRPQLELRLWRCRIAAPARRALEAHWGDRLRT